MNPRVFERIGRGGVVLRAMRVASCRKQIDCRLHASEDIAVDFLPRLWCQAAVIISVVIARWVVFGQRTTVTAWRRLMSVSRNAAGELC